MLNGAHPLEILLRLMFISVGGFLLLICLWFAGNNAYVMWTYNHAEAEVISSERIGPVAYKGLNSYSVQVRFQGPDGRQTASVDRSTTHFEVGEIIDVYYIPATAYRVIAGGFWQMWFHITMIGAVALVFLFYGLRPISKKSIAR